MAVKVIDIQNMLECRGNKASEMINREIEIMQHISHPNVVRLFDVKREETFLYMALEYLNFGNLETYLTGNRLSEIGAHYLMKQIASGLQAIHNNDFAVHRDLTPNNILLNMDNGVLTAKIADFGSARLNTGQMHSLVCTLQYQAPEVMTADDYGANVDYWSLGLILYRMLCGDLPWHGDGFPVWASEPEFYQLPAEISASSLCRELVRGLLQRNPFSRIEKDKLFEHKWLRTPSGDIIRWATTLNTVATETIQQPLNQVREASLEHGIAIDLLVQRNDLDGEPIAYPECWNNSFCGQLPGTSALLYSRACDKGEEALAAEKRGELKLCMKLYKESLDLFSILEYITYYKNQGHSCPILSRLQLCISTLLHKTTPPQKLT